MRKLLLNTTLSALFLTAPLFASDNIKDEFTHAPSQAHNQEAQGINFQTIMRKLPRDIKKLVSFHMDEDTFKNFRLISKAHAHRGFHRDVLLARGTIFVMKDREDLPAFAQMMKKRKLYNIPIKIDNPLFPDEGLQYLTQATTVNLTWCSLITNGGLQHLTQATTVNLKGCNITGKGLQYLTQATSVNLGGCKRITDEDLQYLTQAKKVNLNGCNITGLGLQHLTQATTVNLSGCDNIKDEDFKWLSQATSVDLTGCFRITDKGLSHLTKVKNLTIYNCSKVTKKDIEDLRARGIKVFAHYS